MLADVFLFLSIYLCFLFVLFFSGFLVLRLFKSTFLLSGFYTKSFLSLLCGLVLLVTFFAVFKTQSLTVTLFFPFVFFLAFYGRKIRLDSLEKKVKTKRSFGFICCNVLLILLPFVYFSLVVFKSGEFHFRILEYDNAVYGHLSSSLADTGLENKWYSYFTHSGSIKGLEPYHYIECWLNAAVISLFKTNPLLSFYLVTYPLLLLISSFGILALIERFKNIQVIDLALSFLLLFIGAFYQVKTFNYHFNTMASEIPLQHYGEKFSVYYPFLLLIILLLIHNYREEALICGLSLCIVSSTLVPAVFVFCVFYGLLSLRKKNLSLLLKLFFFLVSLTAFYKVFSFHENSFANTTHILNFSDLETFQFTFAWFKLATSNFFFAFVMSLAHFLANYFYVPLIILSATIYIKKELLKPILSSLLLCLSGLLSACFMYKFSENYQLFTNTLPLLHVVIIMLLILLLYSSTPQVKRFSLFFILSFSFYTLYSSLTEYYKLSSSLSVSDDYILRTKSLILPGKQNQKIAFIYNQADADSLLNNRTKNYLSHLAYLGIDPVPLRMSILEVKNKSYLPAVQKDDDLILKHELFYSFCLKNKDLFLTPDSLKLNFLKFYKINYLLLSPTVSVPNFINPKNSTVVRDNKTGIRFIRLSFS